ncbi:L-ribulose-5-phosphate 4-epimerase [Pseudaeromonas paramecii]|uniref:L-ribulose-5-phosphate 4-epimerase n=1 Tax=Pseudaeromonas paramecii TaxID=2138166 RepID=A0ABP8QFH3_9GAMM
MTLNHLKQAVLEANLDLPRHGLVTFTWGNVSGIDKEQGLVVIKPSGVSYDKMRISDLVVLDLQGNRVAGELRPSSDTPTHLALYRRFPELGGIVHTHSTHATAWAQARRAIPLLGTTQADYFHGAVPCSRLLTPAEVEADYEGHTGTVIIETLGDVPPLTLPGTLVANHGPFSWGKDAHEAVHNAVVLEEVARMAWITLSLAPQAQPLPDYLLEKHYQRKHGKHAYYGQPA